VAGFDLKDAETCSDATSGICVWLRITQNQHANDWGFLSFMNVINKTHVTVSQHPSV
jgi:hypothetical protein